MDLLFPHVSLHQTALDSGSEPWLPEKPPALPTCHRLLMSDSWEPQFEIIALGRAYPYTQRRLPRPDLEDDIWNGVAVGQDGNSRRDGVDTEVRGQR